MERDLPKLKGAKSGCRLLQVDQGVGLPPFFEGPRIVSLDVCLGALGGVMYCLNFYFWSWAVSLQAW